MQDSKGVETFVSRGPGLSRRHSSLTNSYDMRPLVFPDRALPLGDTVPKCRSKAPPGGKAEAPTVTDRTSDGDEHSWNSGAGFVRTCST